MANAHGSKHWVGFKPQAVAGTAETTVNTFLLSTGIQINKNPKHIERKAFISTGRQMPMLKGWSEPSGKLTTEVAASQPHPWYWAMGTVNTTTPTTGVYLHTITIGDPVNLTCEADRVFDKAKQADVKIDKLTLTANVGEVATLAIETLGCSHTDGATLTSTPAFVTDVLTTRASLISIDGAQDFTAQDVEVAFDGGLEQLPVLESADGAPHVVRRKDVPKTSGKLKFIDFPTALLTKLVNATSFALIVYLEGDTISGNYKKFLRVTMPACQFTDGFDPDISAEVITGEASFGAFYDTVTSIQMKVEAQNTIATING